MARVSIAIVISHPIQYWVPVYRELTKNEKLRVKVYFVAENGAQEYWDPQFNRPVKWDVPLTHGYEHQFLIPGNIVADYSFTTIDYPQVTSELESFAPDFVWVHGYAQRINWRILFSRRRNYKVIFSSDSNLEDKRSGLKNLLKSLVLKSFYRKVDLFLSCGQRNTEYLLNYGATSKNIISSTIPVDVGYFTKQASSISSQDLAQFKSELQIPSNHRILLFSGKLIPHKRAKDCVEAMSRLRSLKVSLLIMGSGELHGEILNRVNHLGLQDRVKLIGFVNQSDLAKYFLLSDILLFPSSKEPFGVIASEALVFGLPIIAAQNIGAVGSTIVPGKNALIYPCGDAEILAQKISQLLNNEELLASYSKASLAMADTISSESVAVDISKHLVK